MALFESYERRIDKINSVLSQYGIGSFPACFAASWSSILPKCGSAAGSTAVNPHLF